MLASPTTSFTKSTHSLNLTAYELDMGHSRGFMNIQDPLNELATVISPESNETGEWPRKGFTGSIYCLHPAIFDISYRSSEAGSLLHPFTAPKAVQKDFSVGHWFDAIPTIIHIDFQSDGNILYHRRCPYVGMIQNSTLKLQEQQNESEPKEDEEIEEGQDPILIPWSTKWPCKKQKHWWMSKNKKTQKKTFNQDTARIVGVAVANISPLSVFHGNERKLVIQAESLSGFQEIDLMSLESKSFYSFKDAGIVLNLPCTCPHSFTSDDYTYHVGMDNIERDGYAKYYVIATGLESKVIAKFKEKPRYIHSFVVTDNFVVIMFFPLFYKKSMEQWKSNDGKGYQTLMDAMEYLPNEDTLIYVISKGEGSVSCVYRTEACFAFHVINGYEDGNNIIIDVNVYHDTKIIESFSLARLRDDSSSAGIPYSCVRRYTLEDINVESARFDGAGGVMHLFPLAHFVSLTHFSVELPCVPPAMKGKKHSEFYGISVNKENQGAGGLLWNSLVKVDLEHKKPQYWHESGMYPSEPILVDADGLLLVSIVFDATKRKSFLVVLSADSMKEIVRFNLGEPIPISFLHGTFVASKNLLEE